jgi:uncharacterized protein YegL
MADNLDLAFTANNSQRLACALVLDCSGSMQQDNHINQLNEGVKILEQELKRDPMARMRVQILVVRCGGGVRIESNWTDAVEFTAPVLEASGDTPLGAASIEALRAIEAQVARYKANGIPYNRPWLFLMTDGAPTDPQWQDCARQIREAAIANKIVVYPLGVAAADKSPLSLFQKPGDHVGELQGVQFGELFRWLSRSVGAVASTAPGAPIQQEIPPGKWDRIA